MLGYSWEELKKFSWAELTYPDDLAADVAQFEQLLAGKIDSYTMDKRFIHKNGSIVYAFISVTARYQKNGTIDYIVATLQDITARKQAEEVVQKERDKSLSILNAIPSGVYIASKQYDLEYVNQVIEKKLGPFNGRKCYAYFHDRTEICPWCKNEKVLAGESVRWDWYLPKNDKCYDLFDAPIKNVDGSISKIEIIHDITERKQAEIALIQAKKEADSANQAKSTFLSNMSHELRTPLNAILGFAQILHHSHTLPSEHQENVKIINRSGEHLLSLINDVLDMSKIEAGKIILDEQNFDLHHLLNEVHDLFHLKAKEKNLQLLVEQSGVQRYICTDGTKLRQVLLNLLSNAMKFTQEGGVSVYVDEIPIQEKSENTHLHFRVEDTGAGVAEAELDKLFEAFSQTATGKASQQGTGLGLPISRKFVQLMGGDISVKSTVGKGTQFKFSIRAKKVNAADIVDKQSPARQVIALEPNQPRYRILIVDDKWDNRQLLIQLLNPLGFELKEAENGEEAIEIWEKWQPHLIWMDLRMPVLDGLEATKQIKSTPQGAETAIITLTASILEEEKQNVLAAGCDEFLRKPFKNADIFDLMHKHIGVRYVYEESTESVPESTEALTPESLAVLPSELLIDLKKAAASSNMKKVNRLIEEIRKKHHKGLGNALAILGNEFRYEEIVALIVDDIKGF
jgi:PAS domain S-box-containing protein